MTALLEVRDLAVSYEGVIAVRGVDLTVDAGQALAIVGPNGAGKTSTVQALCGLVALDRGTIRLQGNDITKLRVHERAQAGLAFVPSGRWLFPSLSVEQNVEIGRSVSADSLPVESAFDNFPELADRRNVPAGSLSGGQQQMLALARALIGQPSLLILDEPSLGLAPIIVERLYGKLAELKRAGLGVVVVEEKTQFALELSDAYLAMSNGRVTSNGAVTGSRTESELIAKSYLG
jgi:branched-chain amino acid transport system ATP-binding protein